MVVAGTASLHFNITAYVRSEAANRFSATNGLLQVKHLRIGIPACDMICHTEYKVHLQAMELN